MTVCQVSPFVCVSQLVTVLMWLMWHIKCHYDIYHGAIGVGIVEMVLVGHLLTYSFLGLFFSIMIYFFTSLFYTFLYDYGKCMYHINNISTVTSLLTLIEGLIWRTVIKTKDQFAYFLVSGIKVMVYSE